MKINLICLLSISTLLIANTTHAFDPTDLKVNLTLAEPYKTDYLVGEPIKFDVEIENLSDEPVTIVRPKEGSTNGIRYPKYQFNVEQPLDIPKPSMAGCGNIAYLGKEDFVTIPPQGSFRPEYRKNPTYTPMITGKHEISYVVKFNAEKKAYEGGGHLGYKWKPELSELYDQVPKVDIQSETYTINVVSHGNTLDPSIHCIMGMPYSEILKIFYYSQLNTQLSLQELEDSTYYHNPSHVYTTDKLEMQIHFDESKIVDGIKFYNDFIECYPNAINNELLNDLLIWSRGKNEEIPYEVIYENGNIKTVNVGYFTNQN